MKNIFIGLLIIFVFSSCAVSANQVKIKAKKSQGGYEFELDINKTANKVNVNTIAAQGCCSRHGGVCGCDSSGRTRCCDGSLSPSCRCR